METKRIKIEVAPKGTYIIHKLEGFSGVSCTGQAQELEVALGGQVVDEGKTDAYYNPDDSAPVSIVI